MNQFIHIVCPLSTSSLLNTRMCVCMRWCVSWFPSRIVIYYRIVLTPLPFLAIVAFAYGFCWLFQNVIPRICRLWRSFVRDKTPSDNPFSSNMRCFKFNDGICADNSFVLRTRSYYGAAQRRPLSSFGHKNICSLKQNENRLFSCKTKQNESTFLPNRTKHMNKQHFLQTKFETIRTVLQPRPPIRLIFVRILGWWWRR